MHSSCCSLLMQLQVQQSPEGQERILSHETECREFLIKEGHRSWCCCWLWAVIHVQLCWWPPNQRAQCKLPWTWLEWTVGAEHLPSVFCPAAECLKQAETLCVCPCCCHTCSEGLVLPPATTAAHCLLLLSGGVFNGWILLNLWGVWGGK